MSTTPPGSPPKVEAFGNQNANTQQAPQQDTSAILAALANMAKQNPAAQPTAGLPGQGSLNSMLGVQNGNPALPPNVNGLPTANGQPVNPLGAIFAGMSNGVQQTQSPAPPNPFAAFLPQPQAPPVLPQAAPVPAPGSDAQQQQIQLLQILAAQGVPPDQWATALQLLNMQTAQPQTGVPGMPFPAPLPANTWPGQNSSSRDAFTRSPPNQYRRRSRSPGWERRRDASPRRRRDSPVYGDQRNGTDRDGDRGNAYRRRSPPRRRQSLTPPKDQALPPPGPRSIEWDRSMPPGCIKVLSRTLFVGGVTSSEPHLRSLFAPYGIVQTCIVNVDKRHAFVKMLYRKDAVVARTAMEEYKDGNNQLRVRKFLFARLNSTNFLQTKWGVGFGPRDCSDYQTGISVIPIERLTDADRKWMLTAEYGGTGGQAIEPGMIVEEPDIEIGAGVSSKGMSLRFFFVYPPTQEHILIRSLPIAMSRRIATDKGGMRGPQSSRVGQPISGREQRNDRPMSSNNNGAFTQLPPGFDPMQFMQQMQQKMQQGGQ
jgi:protein NRD1